MQIMKPTGEKAYTRAGSFKRDSDGKIVTSDGYAWNQVLLYPIIPSQSPLNMTEQFLRRYQINRNLSRLERLSLQPSPTPQV
jgi:flagellar basal body rod protein FlgG